MSDVNEKIVEWHYAPIAGLLQRKVNGVVQIPKDWAAVHEQMNEFLTAKSNGSISLKETVTFGHPLHHGYSGRVDIYH